MHASHRGLWRAPRRRGWRGAVPDVQSSDSGRQPAPTYLSSDHDPLYRFHQWQANLRILDVKDIKTVPYVPLSHPFVERLIGTIRRECLDRTLFWTAADLEMKLLDFQRYFNGHRTHAGLGGRDAGTAHGRGRRTRECQFVSLAAALSWAVSDADRGMRCVHDVRRRRTSKLAPCRPIPAACAPFLSEPAWMRNTNSVKPNPRSAIVPVSRGALLRIRHPKVPGDRKAASVRKPLLV